MSQYAVKIGEIHLRSDKPITDEERKAAIKLVLKSASQALDGGNGDLDIVAYVGPNQQSPT